MNYTLKTSEIEAIEKHYKHYFSMTGAIDSKFVMHEIVSDEMHIDIVHYFSSKDFPYQILATIGMSGYTMHNAPYSNIELIMFLPKDWKIGEKFFKDENCFWPIKMLKTAARLPYLTKSFISVGHTFSMDNKNSPFALGTNMCSGLITFPTWLDHDIFTLKTGTIFNKKKINFLCLTAITENELNLLNKIGPQKFIDEILIKNNQDDLEVRNVR